MPWPGKFVLQIQPYTKVRNYLYCKSAQVAMVLSMALTIFLSWQKVGSIGWETYFIGSGLIQITLPTDISVMDEEGRSARSIKRKAS